MALTIFVKLLQAEHSLPQQYIHAFKDGQFTTSPVSHSGAWSYARLAIRYIFFCLLHLLAYLSSGLVRCRDQGNEVLVNFDHLTTEPSLLLCMYPCAVLISDNVAQTLVRVVCTFGADKWIVWFFQRNECLSPKCN